MKKIINFLSRNKTLFFILLLGLTPLLWFKDGLLITGGDFCIPLDPIGMLKTFLYTWYPSIFCGGPNVLPYFIVPWLGFWAFLKFLGFPLLVINKMWFIFVFMLTGLSMYYLVSVIFEKERHQVAALVASIFYMFNVYVMLVTPIIATPLVYAVLPLMLGLYIKGLKEEKSSTKYAVLMAIASLLIVSAACNPPIYAICGLMIFFYLIYHIATKGKKTIAQSVVFTFKVGAIYSLLNLWWVYPYITNVLMSQASLQKETLQPKPMGAAFYETVRLFGSWAFYCGFRGAAYIPYAYHYKTIFFTVLTFIIPILAFLALPIFLFKQRKNRFIPFFLITAVLGIILAHGAYPDFLGRIFWFLYFHIPGFWIFREPFAKFTAITAISYAVLIGFSTDGIYKLIISKNSKGRYNALAKTSVVCVILIILTCAWPILTGDVIFEQRGEMKSHHVKIPDYWFKAARWFNEQNEDFRVLVLPLNPVECYAGLPYKWGYEAGDITPQLIHKSLVEVRSGVPFYEYNESFGPHPAPKKLMELVYSCFHQDLKQVPDIKKILSLMNVKYILQRNDVELIRIADSYRRSFYSPEHIKSILEAQQGVHLERTFGELDIYKIDDKYFLPHIYAARGAILVSGDMYEMFKVATLKNFRPDEFALLLSKQANPAQWKFIQDYNAIPDAEYSPDIAFQRLSPTKYKVRVTDAAGPFFLVFNEGYHPHWKIFADGEEIGQHLIVNGYANAWYLSKSGTYDITLDYQAQRVYRYGEGISLIALLVSILYLAKSGGKYGL